MRARVGTGTSPVQGLARDAASRLSKPSAARQPQVATATLDSL